jgi:hypothetical protein
MMIPPPAVRLLEALDDDDVSGLTFMVFDS